MFQKKPILTQHVATLERDHQALSQASTKNEEEAATAQQTNAELNRKLEELRQQAKAQEEELTQQKQTFEDKIRTFRVSDATRLIAGKD